MMQKTNLKQELRELYTPSASEPVLVDVPEMAFLMVDGSGDPNTDPAFAQAIEALYGVAYTLKFALKKAGGFPDFTVLPLEALWWVEGGEILETDKGAWSWRAMIAQPDFVTADQVAGAMSDLEKRKNPPALSQVRFQRFCEGPSAQILHVGPYSEERPTIERLYAFIEAQGLARRGRHHEIYLGDPRRSAPEKLKTVVRQPVGPA